jgi:pimeloyl-ACP methyl ester carboxylesterase
MPDWDALSAGRVSLAADGESPPDGGKTEEEVTPGEEVATEVETGDKADENMPMLKPKEPWPARGPPDFGAILVCDQCIVVHSALDFSNEMEFHGCEAADADVLVVCVHGGGGSRHMWLPQIEDWVRFSVDEEGEARARAETYSEEGADGDGSPFLNIRYCTLDLSGHGSRFSRALTTGYEVERLASLLYRGIGTEFGSATKLDDDDVALIGAAVRGLPEFARVIYAGNSLGSYLGMELLGREGSSELIDGAILCGAGQRVGVGRGPAASVGLAAMGFGAKVVSPLTMTRSLVQQGFKSGHIAVELIESSVLRGGMYFHRSAEQIHALKESNPEAALGKFKNPVLYVNGGKDEHDSQERWLELSQLANPKSRLVTYEEGDHFFMSDDRCMPQFSRDVQDFVREIVREAEQSSSD